MIQCVALQQALQGDLCFETHLGFHTDIHQDAAVLVPLAQALQVAGAAFVIDNEGNHIPAKTFFQHQEPTDASVAVFKWADPLETDMKLENLMKSDFFLDFILSEECVE